MHCDVNSRSNDKECYKYSVAINDKGDPFPAEPLIMAYYCYNKKWSIGYYPELLKKNLLR